MKIKNTMRRRMAFLLAMMLLFSTVLGQSTMKMTAKAVGYGISNPTTDSNGVTTWDCIYFGNYWQSSETSKEPIKWRVLSVDGDDAFLLADQNLDCKKYNETYTSVTWETCTLRSWLNGYGAGNNTEQTDYSTENFLDAAFSQTEQSAIKTTSVINDNNPLYGTEGGNDTQDKIYLLSIAEASNASYGFNTTFNTPSDTRVSTNTAHTANYSGMNSTGGADWWWLRSPGNYSYDASFVTRYGWGYDYGDIVYYDNIAVRPALHLNLSSDVWRSAGKVTSAGGSTGGEVSPTETPERIPEETPSGESSGLSCAPSLTVEEGRLATVNARAYAGTKEELASLSSAVSWSSSDSSVAEVQNGGFIQSAAPATYSGPEGGYSLWWATGLVTVRGCKPGTVTVTGKSPDGNQVSCQVTVIDEEEDASGSVGNGGSLEIGEEQEGSADANNGVIQFFPASWSLKSTKYPVSLSQTENTDGSYTLKASIGFGRSDWLDKDTEWSKYKKACETANENTSSYEALSQKLLNNEGLNIVHSYEWKGHKKPSLSVMGYVENKYDKYGNLISAEGKIAGDLSWKGDASWQFATPIGPMYLKLGVEGKASLEGGPSWDNKDRKMSLDGKLTITPAISLTGGYGIDKVASISATGKASVGVQAYPKSKGTFTGEASVNVYALFVVDYTWTLAKYTKPMWDTTGEASMGGRMMMANSLQQGEPSFIDTQFASGNTGWKGEQKLSGARMARANQDKRLILEEGLLPSSLPLLAQIGDKQIMVWQEYDENRSVANSAVLTYSVYENGVWSNPKAVYDDGYGDACADMQVIGGKLCLTWQKHKVLAAGDADEAIGQIGQHAEIYYAEFDSSSNAFADITQVTDNTYCDMMPRLMQGSEKIAVAYVRNDENSILQSEGNNAVYVSEWNGTGFDTEQKLVDSPGTVERYAVYMEEGKPKAMYVTKANDMVTVLNSDNEVTEELNSLIQMAEDGTVSAVDYVDGEIRLISNGVLYCYQPLTGGMTSYEAGNSAFDATAVYCTNGTKNGYVWSTYDEESDTGRIVASMGTDTGYSEPVTIYETEGEISRHIAPVMTEEGAWNLALNQEVTKDGIHTLSYLCQQENAAISLIDAYVNEGDVIDGMTGVEYVFTNKGDVTVDEITVQITLADGTVIKKNVSITVQPGETVAETTYVDLSEVTVGQDISIIVYESNQMPDADNIVTDVIEQTDVALVGTATEDADGMQITAYATNKGQRAAVANLSLYDNQDMKNQIASEEEIDIAIGETKKVSFKVSPDAIIYNENGAAYITLYADVEGGDFNTSDNIAYLALYQGEKIDANTEEKGIENSVVDIGGVEETNLPSVTKTPDSSILPTITPSKTEQPAPIFTPGSTVQPTVTPGRTAAPTQTPGIQVTLPPINTRLKSPAGDVYTVTKNGEFQKEATFTSPRNKKASSIKIPATVTLQGITYKVTAVRAGALRGCKKLKRVTIGKNVRVIGAKAFYGCTSLKQITVMTKKLKKGTVGNKAFAGIHARAKVKVPGSRFSSYRKIFRKRGLGGKKQKVRKL